MASHDTISKLCNLPPELQDEIYLYVLMQSSREELKTFRSLNRRIGEYATTLLFSTLHISGSIHSFHRLRRIAESPHLAIYVKELIFHRGSWATDFTLGTPMKRVTTWATFRYLLREQRVVEAMNEVHMFLPDYMEMREMYENLSMEVASEALFSNRVEFNWMTEISEVSAYLTNLSAVNLPDLNLDPPSQYLRRRTGVKQAGLASHFFSPARILQATQNCTLKHLHLHNIMTSNGFVVDDGPPAIPLQHYARLQTLALSFADFVEYSWSHFHHSGSRGPAWVRIIEACSSNLRSLRLDTGRKSHMPQDQIPGSFQQMIMSEVLKMRFPKLRELSLANVVMEEEAFVGFVENHASSMKQLSIAGWQIPFRKRSNGSFLRAFYRIGLLDTKLESVSLDKKFSNRSDGCGWIVSDLDPEQSLRPNGDLSGVCSKELRLCARKKFEEYMCGRAPFPIDIKGPSLKRVDEIPYLLSICDESLKWSS